MGRHRHVSNVGIGFATIVSGFCRLPIFVDFSDDAVGPGRRKWHLSSQYAAYFPIRYLRNNRLASERFDHRAVTRQTGGNTAHLVAPWTRTPEMRILRRRGMATTPTDKRFIRSPEHWLEFAVQYTVRTANNLLRHSFLHSLCFDSRTNLEALARLQRCVPLQGRHGTNSKAHPHAF